MVAIGQRIDGTANVTLDNVEIFGIGNGAIEKIKFQDGSAPRFISFDAVDWPSIVDQIDDKSRSKYIGDAYSDLMFAVDSVESSWYFRNSLFVNNDERAFVFDGDTNAFLIVFPSNSSGLINCGTDIQLHSSKGAIGLRADGVQNLNVDGLYIHHVYCD